MAVPLASSAKVVSFGGFKRRVGGVALCDLPTCLVTCPKPFCVTGAIFLCRFEKMTFIFRGRRNLHRHFAWQAQHLRDL